MRIRIIDAFTDQPFRGNPAAVCLLEDTWPDEDWMRQVAAEMNLSETAFAHPVDDGDADYALRWFTPEVETDLCGHATLATAHALHQDRGTPATVRFTTRSGILVAHSFDDGRITLDFPAATITEAAAPHGLAEALGTQPVAAYRTGALGDLLVVLSDEDTVRGLRPDLASIARIEQESGIRGVIVTAESADYDFVSRFFAPKDGIPEDPVTGSAHTALAPYWAQRTGRTSLVGLQASKRTGVVRTEVHGDRVHLTGHAVTVLDGLLQIASKAVAGSVSGGPAGSHSAS
ncbi:PhzF family phenazine biosynthesis protein [Kibdelosporangium aridum]|uniref:Phenazine biosynthesis protein PhzF family n=1 Tax=Kibdelosporangium aridum TaxID=2030 RepID=A0A1Y5X5D1_KIBAR|nr:PhzF family phenazine biosynthesis protein [Kibdelosporangium aridum]SMC71532.1 phenazine biosynthesis protein PhzF family [Kibdelosporangium aridum]